jgi:hypothetical protein
MRELWPPLNAIQARLRPTPAPSSEAEPLEIIGIAEPLPMPDFIRERIDRSVAAQGIRDTPLAPGVIVLVPASSDGTAANGLTSPMVFCLDALKVRRDGMEEWTGWVCSPDVDYATDKDVLLEPEDEPFDPTAGMVQTWNALTLEVPQNAPVLAKLSDYRLNIVREVATEGGATVPPAPGKIGLRATQSGRSVLTGSRLNGPDDPRVAYQKLYADVAQSLDIAPRSSEVVRQTSTATDTKTGDIREWLFGHRAQVAGFAATLAGVVVAAHVLLRGSEISGPSPGHQVAMNKPGAVDAPVPPPPAPQASAADKPTQHESPSVAASEKPLKKEPVKVEAVRKEKGPATGTSGSDTRLATTESETVFLSPLKGKAFELAMRSGNNAPSAVVAYRVRVKDRSRLDEAVKFLNSLGLNVSRVDEKTGRIDVIARKDLTKSVLELNLKASGLYRTVSPNESENSLISQ